MRGRGRPREPEGRRLGKLETLHDVRKAMVRVIRSTWRGDTEPHEGHRVVAMLVSLRDTIYLAEIEPKLTDMEKRIQAEHAVSGNRLLPFIKKA